MGTPQGPQWGRCTPQSHALQPPASSVPSPLQQEMTGLLLLHVFEKQVGTYPCPKCKRPLCSAELESLFPHTAIDSLKNV